MVHISLMAIKSISLSLIALALLIAPPASSGQASSQSHCLSYEPTVVTLSGTLVRKTFPGPPDYESVKNGDKPETSWFLELPASLCVNEDPTQPDLNPKRSGVHEIQLILEPKQYQQHKDIVGSVVNASGTLVGEHTAHHHTSVLLIVHTLRKRMN